MEAGKTDDFLKRGLFDDLQGGAPQQRKSSGFPAGQVESICQTSVISRDFSVVLAYD